VRVRYERSQFNEIWVIETLRLFEKPLTSVKLYKQHWEKTPSFSTHPDNLLREE